MNIIELKKEINTQIDNLQNELNSYLNPLGYYAKFNDSKQSFSFSIEDISGQHFALFKDFIIHEKAATFNQEYFNNCKVIIDSYSLL